MFKLGWGVNWNGYECSRNGGQLWPLLRQNYREHRPRANIWRTNKSDKRAGVKTTMGSNALDPTKVNQFIGCIFYLYTYTYI